MTELFYRGLTEEEIDRLESGLRKVLDNVVYFEAREKQH
jgi:hypothetical protein